MPTLFIRDRSFMRYRNVPLMLLWTASGAIALVHLGLPHFGLCGPHLGFGCA